MSKVQQEIMVIPRSTLLGNNSFQGFCDTATCSFLERIISSSRFMNRELAEKDLLLKQPIGYVIVVQQSTKKIFSYQRARGAPCNEERLRGKWSWGLGGHCEKHDAENGDAFLASIVRELREEIGFGDARDLTLLGYINTDEDHVGKVHFGVCYVMQTERASLSSSDPACLSSGFRTIQELDELMTNPHVRVETWSRIALPAVKNFLGV